MNIQEEIKKLKSEFNSRVEELEKKVVKEEEFKVGDWVKWSGCNPRVGKILGKCPSFNDSWQVSTPGTSCSEVHLRKATPLEIESHLIKEAEKKGFVRGAKVYPVNAGSKNITYHLEQKKYDWTTINKDDPREIIGFVLHDNRLFVRIKGTADYKIYDLDHMAIVPPHPQIKLGQYDVEFFDSHILVGCTRVELSTIKEILNHFEKEVRP